MATTPRADSNRKATRERPAGKARRGRRPSERPRRGPAPAPEPSAASELPEIPLATPEPAFRERVPPAPPERPRPTARRAVFLDVENTSKPQHLAHVIDHLAINRRDVHTDLVAVANWKVVGQECARLLAQRGAQLVHSAPSTGVRDWSDLRIAVAAGLWLAGARPGDVIEVVSDDRAFDAIGDVAASLGIGFHRLSYRQLAKQEAPGAPVGEPVRAAEPDAGSRRRRHRRGRGRPGTTEPPHLAPRPRPHAPPPAEDREAGARPEPARPRSAGLHGHRPHAEGHTAPHDELVAVVRELVEASPRRSIVLDAVANALKARGFQRPPGSPRLVTRLRRIRELVVSPSGMITLADDAASGRGTMEAGAAAPPEAEAGGETGRESEAATTDAESPAAGRDRPTAGPRGRRRRRRRRRGGPRPSGQGAPAV